MKKIITLFCLVCISTLFLIGCNKAEETSGKIESGDEKNKPVQEQEKNVFPFTGLETNDQMNQRAVVVTINNQMPARPQSGLQKADIVYEMLAEGEITRFLAVYQSEQPERVGPVRSARNYFLELAKGYDCIYICHGNSEDARIMLEEDYVDHLNGLYYDGTLFKRDDSRKAPHNSYISFENIVKGAEEKGFEMTGQYEDIYTFLSEDEVQNLSGENATTIDVKYFTSSFDVTYEYDETIERYKRFTAGEQMIDKDTGEEILIDNIVVMETLHTLREDGRRDIDLQTGGKGYLFQKGKWTTIEWESVDNLLTFVKDGEKVKLVPGKTWINIIPNKPGIESKVSIQ